jgi:hypothetical protein
VIGLHVVYYIYDKESTRQTSRVIIEWNWPPTQIVTVVMETNQTDKNVTVFLYFTSVLSEASLYDLQKIENVGGRFVLHLG